MQIITISGNCGREPELRTTQGGDDICSFSVGCKQGWGDKASTNWFRVNVWGKRARSMRDNLRKGTKVVVHGELTIGEYQGKPQYDIRANEVEFMPKGDVLGERKQPYDDRGGTNQQTARDTIGDDLDSDVPF